MQSLSIIIPTWNEADNIEVLYQKIVSTMDDIDWHIIIVDDDSEDKTWQVGEQLSAKDSRVRVIRRIGRSGLTSACIEGIAASETDLCAVIDADLQHDETLLPQMVEIFSNQNDTDLVVASRKIASASFGSMPRHRVFVSEVARKLTQIALSVPLSDPMSGFFMIKRTTFKAIEGNLFGRGFKILLDVCAASPQPLKISELPYQMRARNAGESKLKWQVIFEFLAFLVFQFFGRRFNLPPKFIKFCMVGLSGVVVHMSVLTLAHKLASISFLYSQILATLVAMASNFIINNNFTFREQKLEGVNFYTGAMRFAIICGIGGFIGVTVSDFLHDEGLIWWAAGTVSILLTAVWNFSVNNIFTWKDKSRN